MGGWVQAARQVVGQRPKKETRQDGGRRCAHQFAAMALVTPVMAVTTVTVVTDETFAIYYILNDAFRQPKTPPSSLFAIRSFFLYSLCSSSFLTTLLFFPASSLSSVCILLASLSLFLSSAFTISLSLSICCVYIYVYIVYILYCILFSKSSFISQQYKLEVYTRKGESERERERKKARTKLNGNIYRIGRSRAQTMQHQHSGSHKQHLMRKREL